MYTAVSIEGDNLFVHTYTLDGKFESVPYYAFGVTKTSEWEAPVDNNNGKFPYLGDSVDRCGRRIGRRRLGWRYVTDFKIEK